jgi:hypothetical protein
MAGREDQGTDPLFGSDATSGDGVGPLPGFVLPVLELPTVGPDGTVRGVAGGADPVEEPSAGTDPADPLPRARTVGEEAARRGLVPGRATAPAEAARPVPPVAPDPAPPGPPAVPGPGPLTGPRPTPPIRPGTGPARSGRLAGGARRADPSPRPRVEPEPSILGLSRRSHSRLGSRLFTLFFVAVYAVIVIQLVVALLGG